MGTDKLEDWNSHIHTSTHLRTEAVAERSNPSSKEKLLQVAVGLRATTPHTSSEGRQ